MNLSHSLKQRKELIMNLQNLEMKRHFVSDKIIIGIDPCKKKYQAMIINEKGIPMGNSFSFQNSYNGFHLKLWQKVKSQVGIIDPNNIVFSIETSINFWQKLCYYLHDQGYTILLVRPLTTKYERPRINCNFSKTDPKDALVVANSARQGYFHFYQEYSDPVRAMHSLAISYDKLKKQLVIAKQRLRSQVDQLFPEFSTVMKLDSDTARYLLSKYITPQDFLNMNIFQELISLRKVSRNHHGVETLNALMEVAGKSIGISLDEASYNAERITMNLWIVQIDLLKQQMYSLLKQMVELTEKTPYFKILTSIKGISDITAARFIAENRELFENTHYKKIEAFAGTNLKLSQSGTYMGYRRITHIGNNRLRAVLYKMTEETKNHIPEVRIKFLKRQMKQARYTKNIVACSSNLLKLIVALIREKRTYVFNQEKLKELEKLEIEYQTFKENKSNKKKLIKQTV
jgi:transposase